MVARLRNLWILLTRTDTPEEAYANQVTDRFAQIGSPLGTSIYDDPRYDWGVNGESGYSNAGGAGIGGIKTTETT